MSREEQYRRWLREQDWPSHQAPGEEQKTRLRLARERAGMSQRELALKAAVPFRTLQRIEDFRTAAPQFNTLFRLAWALGCGSIGEIIEPSWTEWPAEAGDRPGGRPPSLGVPKLSVRGAEADRSQ